MLHAVIMAGGSGTRFWPQSRNLRPKQLLQLAGDTTMIQQTIDRVDGLCSPQECWIATGQHLVEETARQLPQLSPENFVIEPCARNTAPCIGLAAAKLVQVDPNAVMLVMPADHVIAPTERFQSAVRTAVDVLSERPDHFLLFGVKPSYAATGFGYIEQGESLNESAGVYGVRSFKEKPNADTAESYLAAGNYLWNCGIFVWRADRILASLNDHEPEMHAGLQRIATDNSMLEEEFPRLKSISIDYAVLERAKNVAVIEAPFDWDDLGSWAALPRQSGVDSAGNTIDAESVCLDTSNCIIRAEDGHLIATAGVSDLVIVHSGNATLVARRDDENAIREIVAKLKEQGRSEFL